MIEDNAPLNSEKYQNYLASEEWDCKRKAVLKRDNYTCQGCLENGLSLQVHHLTYEHVFNEFAFELVSLYDECHERIHGIEPTKEVIVSRFNETYIEKSFIATCFKESKIELLRQLFHSRRPKELPAVLERAE